MAKKTWSNPVPFNLIATSISESYKRFADCATGLPIAPHPGAFGVRRSKHIHEGVDLYVPEGTVIRAVECGTVVAVLPFTGEIVDMPWWENTWAVMVEGESGVVLYGEIIACTEVGTEVQAGDVIGCVKRVLKKDKGRPMSMLHLELHKPGTRNWSGWCDPLYRPDSLLDPTPYLRTVEATRRTMRK